jgi:hypothetical protein
MIASVARAALISRCSRLGAQPEAAAQASVAMNRKPSSVFSEIGILFHLLIQPAQKTQLLANFFPVLLLTG